jgi:hypothetical protein
MLDRIIAERVKVFTGGAQHPAMHRPVLIPVFPIVLAHPLRLAGREARRPSRHPTLRVEAGQVETGPPD